MSHDNPQQQTGQPAEGIPTSFQGFAQQSPPARSGGVGRRTSVLGSWGARIVLIVVAACALVSVVFILFGAGGGTLGRVITTDVALIVFALLVWLDTVIGMHRPEWFEFTSLATDAYLLLLWILIIWTDDGSDPFGLALGIWRGILCLVFVRGMLALVDLVRFLFSRWVTTVSRALSFVAACSFGVIAIMVTIPAPTPFEDLWDYEFYGRIVASLAVIGGVALVLIPLWGLLINRSRRAVGTPVGYGQGYAAGYGTGHPAAYGSGYPAPAPAAPGYPGGPSAAPGAWGYQQAAVPPVPAAPPQPAPAPTQQAAAPTTTSAAPAAAPAVHPPLSWPRLANGSLVPVGAGGVPDFAAVFGVPLAWPTFVDGSPVPATADGSPLYR